MGWKRVCIPPVWRQQQSKTSRPLSLTTTVVLNRVILRSSNRSVFPVLPPTPWAYADAPHGMCRFRTTASRRRPLPSQDRPAYAALHFIRYVKCRALPSSDLALPLLGNVLPSNGAFERPMESRDT